MKKFKYLIYTCFIVFLIASCDTTGHESKDKSAQYPDGVEDVNGNDVEMYVSNPMEDTLYAFINDSLAFSLNPGEVKFHNIKEGNYEILVKDGDDIEVDRVNFQIPNDKFPEDKNNPGKDYVIFNVDSVYNYAVVDLSNVGENSQKEDVQFLGTYIHEHMIYLDNPGTYKRLDAVEITPGSEPAFTLMPFPDYESEEEMQSALDEIRMKIIRNINLDPLKESVQEAKNKVKDVSDSITDPS